MILVAAYLYLYTRPLVPSTKNLILSFNEDKHKAIAGNEAKVLSANDHDETHVSTIGKFRIGTPN